MSDNKPLPCKVCKLNGWTIESKDEVDRLRAEVAELLDALEDVIYQSCYDDERGDGHLDSMALSAYAKGMRVLSKHGRFEIEAEGGRRVIGKLKQEGGE